MKQAKSHFGIVRIVSLALALLLSANLLGAGSLGVSATADSQIKGTSVTLGDELVLNFFAEVTDTQGAVMTFQVGGGTQTVAVTQAQNVEGNLYSFPCVLAAAQMTDSVEATLTDSGNTYQKTTTIREYADKLLVSKQWDKLTATDMMISTLNYGAAAQTYFGYNTDNMANAGYEVAATDQIPAAGDTSPATGAVNGISFYGASLVFQSRVAIRFYFKTNNISAYTFSAGEAPVEKNGMYYVEVPDINPQDYAQEVTLTVTDGEDTLSVTYSPMLYISRMYSKTENEALKNLVAVMYQYHDTAVAYVADPLGNDKDNLVSAQ